MMHSAYQRPISKHQNGSHYTIFQQTMQLILFWGQCWGLIPVQGITSKNPHNVRFQLDSFRFWYSIFMSAVQALFAGLFMYKIIYYSVSVKTLGSFCHYSSNSLVTLLSIRTASKWPTLVQEVWSSNMAVNPNIKSKCARALAVFVFIGFVEHILVIIANVTHVLDCYEYDGDPYGGYFKSRFSFIFSVGVPYHLTVGIFLQCFAVACMFNWNFLNPFIIGISFYLTSVFEELNKKISLASKKSLPSLAWQELREDYTRATRLVRLFDSAINHVVFVSFSTSLFFVCLELFFVLSNGVIGISDETCLNFPSGPFKGYELSIRFLFSLLTVLIRALSVPLFAAQVNSASRGALPALYAVPTKHYCNEIQRFIEQIHGDTVCLTGFNFFNLTRDLVLTVAGAIITYELVLLQFQGKNLINASDSITTLRKLNTTL